MHSLSPERRQLAESYDWLEKLRRRLGFVGSPSRRCLGAVTHLLVVFALAAMSWLGYATPTIIEQAKVVGFLSAMLWLFQTVLLHNEVHKPDPVSYTHLTLPTKA